MLKPLIVMCLLVLSLQAKSQSQRKSAVIESQTVLLQAGSSKNFTYKNIDTKKTLMIVIQNPNSPLSPFKLLLNNDKQSIECSFQYGNNLCVIEQPSSTINMQFQCLEKKCQTILQISQRVLIKTGKIDNQFNKQLTTPGEIYKLQKRNFTSLLQIYSDRQERRVSSGEILIYANIHAFRLEQVQELQSNSVIIGLKPIKTDGGQYIFIQGDKLQKNKDLRISIRSHEGIMRQSVSIVDFIETYGHRSKNQYHYAGTFTRNIQVNLRVFAPKKNISLPMTLLVNGSNSIKPNSKQSSPQSTIIRKLQIPNINFQDHRFYDLSFVISNSQHKQFSIIEFEVTLQGKDERAIFIELQVRDVKNGEVNIFQDIYFGTDKGEELIFVVEPQVKLVLAEGNKDIKLLINTNQKYSTSSEICSLQKGCEITVKTQNKCESCQMKFDLSDQAVKNHLIYYDVSENTIEGKIDQEEQLFFRYPLAPQASVQLLINTVNAIIYANLQNYERCKVPRANCHQFVVNHHNPMLITNRDNKPVQLLISVVGLQKTSFKVNLLKENSDLILKLGERFTYLFDDQQNDLTLKMSVSQQDMLKSSSESLSFNLIAPAHSLQLTVKNKDGSTISSADGYIRFSKQSIRGQLFEITVNKIDKSIGDFVRFTIIAEASGMAIRLDQTSTHYQKYQPKGQKSFLIEYNPAQVNGLNIYTQNMEKTKSNMILTIRDISNEDKTQIIVTKTLSLNSQFIDLDQQLEQSDVCGEVNCQLQIKIISKSQSQLEQAITLVSQQSVIYLDDSIWSVFDINQLSRTNHFYFIPHHQNRPITVLFHTDDPHLFVNYRLHNTKNSINPQDWPFHHSNTEEKNHISATQQLIIEGNDPQLLACWPTCVLLINVNEVNVDQKIMVRQQIKSYKIMATDSTIELPEDTKLQFSLRGQQEKTLFLQLKNFQKTQRFTFFTYFMLGRAKITANLLHKGKQYNLAPKGKQFIFEQLQTVVPLYLIKGVVNSNNLKFQQCLLQITIVAESGLKMNIEYSSYLHDIYKLQMEDLQVATLRKGEELWYQFIPERDFTFKFYRIKGFPFVKVIKCQEDHYIDCLSKNKKLLTMQVEEKLKTQEVVRTQAPEIKLNQKKNSNQQQLQVFVEKTMQTAGEACEKCIFYIWVYCFEGDLQLSINVRTRYSEIQLKQMNVINQRLQPGKKYSYLVNSVPQRDALITFRLLQGTASVVVFDSLVTLFNQTLNSVDDDYRDITVNALDSLRDQSKDKPQTSQQQNDIDHIKQGIIRRSHDSNPLRHIHIQVTAISQKPIQFLISYSVGQSSLYIQDGIVIQKRLGPDIAHNFYYHNKDKKSHAYLTISSQIDRDYDSFSPKNEYNARFYYYPDASNRYIREQFKPELPPKRNQNYLGSVRTNVYELPSKFQLFQVQIQSHYYIRITASINHKELIYLPLGFDYLIKLHPEESLHLVVDRPQTDYLDLRIKKCDSSVPSLYYTNDANDFKNGVFTAEMDIESGYFKQLIKTKNTSKTIHLKLIGDEQSDSLFTISVNSASSEQKANTPKYKPGNTGIITYEMLKSSEVEVHFKPITCNGKDCQTTATYYLLLGNNLQDIYSELNCAANNFVTEAKQLTKTAKIQVILIQNNFFDKSSGEYHYQVTLTKKNNFIGIKAVIQGSIREQIIYLPLEISSLWGELSKISLTTVISVALALSCLITLVIIVSAKLARRGYKPISEEQ